MVDIQRKLVACREVWFDEEWSPDGTDIALFYHWSEPVNPLISSPVESLQLDLTLDEPTLWKGFTGSTKNQINRATRELVKFEVWHQPDRAAIDSFFEFYRKFMHARALGTGDPEWMRRYSEQQSLVLTRAVTPEGDPLVWHSYYRSPTWVRQLHSISLSKPDEDKESRNATARANRFLHWMDIREFQRAEIKNFDFGGWYSGSTDEKLLRVNAFKEEFGGARTRRYHSTKAVTLKGRLFLEALKRLRGGSGQLHWV